MGASLYSLASAPASTTDPPLHVFISPLPDAPGCSMSRCQDLVLLFLHACLPRDRELLLHKSACPATNVPTKKAAGCISQVRHVPVFIVTPIVSSYFIASCGAVSCSCEPELSSGTTLPIGMDDLVTWLALFFVAQVPAQLSLLVSHGATLLNKPVYYSLSSC